MFSVLIENVNAKKFSLLLFAGLTLVQLHKLSLANIWSMCSCSTLCFIPAPRTPEDNLPLLQKTSSLAIAPDHFFFYHLEDTEAISSPPPAPTHHHHHHSHQIHPINRCCIVCKGSAQGAWWSVWKTLFLLRGSLRRISSRTKLGFSLASWPVTHS